MGLKKLKQKIQSKIKNNTFFTSRFGFESGIDITDDNQVLYRKNVVIKNIVFVSNLVYTLIFTILSFSDKSNWLLTVLLFPVTFIVNNILTKMIKKGPNDKMSQTIAMYVASFYMFLSTIVIYLKLKVGDADYLKECGYILLYYSLAICAYYQDKKMLKNVFAWLFILVTILHFTITYPILQSDMATNVLQFFKTFFTSPPRGPPGPRRRLSRRSPSRAARVFFSSTFRRTSPLNMMGCRNQGEQIYRVLMNYSQKSSKRAYALAFKDKRKLKKEKQEPGAYK